VDSFSHFQIITSDALSIVHKSQLLNLFCTFMLFILSWTSEIMFWWCHSEKRLGEKRKCFGDATVKRAWVKRDNILVMPRWKELHVCWKHLLPKSPSCLSNRWRLPSKNLI